jgi:hypothetical protein
MKAFVFESSDDLINQLMTMERDVDDDQEYFKGIYSLSLNQIELMRMDYPYLQRTKKFGCWVL